MKPFGDRTNLGKSSNTISLILTNGKKSGSQQLKVDPSKVSQLENMERQSFYQIAGDQVLMRKHLFKWVIAKCRLTLELRISTIEHCMRLFDLYVAKVGNFMSTLEGAQIYLLACLFISSKYMEIYPPTVHDFEYVSKFSVSAKELIFLEAQILKKVDYQLNLPLLSDWIYIYSGKTMKEWVLASIPQLQSDYPLQEYARFIIQQRGFDQEREEINQDELNAQLLKIYVRKN